MVNIFSKITGRKKRDEEEFLEVESSDKADSAADSSAPEEWLEDSEEGRLSVDVYQTSDNIIIKSTIAGVSVDDIDISINNDMITIRGERRQDKEVSEDDYFYQECYWGAFSRSIILPTEVVPEEVEASLKNGVLTVILPKAKKSKSVAVKVKSA
jgi:HSP20 family protein